MTSGTAHAVRAAAFVLYVALAPGSSTIAAVRTCSARLTSIAATASTELLAKKKAIDDWTAKAVAAGIANPAWRLAAERRLVCQALPAKGADAKRVFECIAVGHACSILQNPSKPVPPPAKASDVAT